MPLSDSMVRHMLGVLREFYNSGFGMAFRYNNRRSPYLFRDTLSKLIGSAKLSYEQLNAD